MKKEERKIEDRKIRTTRILEAANKVFAKMGFEKATMNDIASEAGYGKASLYFYFKSKDEIFDALINSEMDKRRESISKILSEEGDPVTKLDKFIDDTFEHIQTKSDFIRIFHSEQQRVYALADEKFRSMFRDAQQAMTKQLGAVISAGIKTGHFRKIDPEIGATVFLGALSSTVVHWFHSKGKISLENYKTQIMDILLKGVSK